ncbi:MAG TPA: hypothetical protein VKA87_10685 [Nitrososphaeraceae archaeon]|nr:hypothetical protein [Nitrososphaeraceae archaeon]
MTDDSLREGYLTSLKITETKLVDRGFLYDIVSEKVATDIKPLISQSVED